MKSKLLLVFCLILNFAYSQTYKPFPADSANWGFYMTSPTGPSYQKEIIKGDTLLGGKNYHKVYNQTNTLLGFYREFAKKIYAKVIFYADTSEILIYDYNLNVGDTFYDKRTDLSITFKYKYLVTSITTTSLTLDSRKQYNFSFEGYQGPVSSYSNLGGACNFYWIEGIGSLKGVFNNRAAIIEGTECYQAALISNASFSTLKCFEHKNVQYMSQSCLTLSNKEFNDSYSLNIYPNPTNEFINIDLGNFSETKKYDLKIINLLGQNVIEDKIENKINISTLKNGIYFLHLYDRENLIATEKIIKE
ncbi:MAG: T9SS type A sorting domain-containing protein [Bacteroidia bacterium]|nr:T9SS type A sorting domain-containing protein [Bacteroidia bacterium]